MHLAGNPGVGTLNPNPLSTYSARFFGAAPSNLGDIDERSVIHYVEGTIPIIVSRVNGWGGLAATLDNLTYDPSNGIISDGDLYRSGP